MHVRCYNIQSINGLKTSTKLEQQCISKYDVILTYTASTQKPGGKNEMSLTLKMVWW